MGPPVLVPLDGSALAERALPPARVLASRLDARLLLVYATGDGKGSAHLGGLAETYLADLAARTGHRGVVETVLLPGDADTAILDQSRLRRVGQIVMATHGRTGMDRLRYGSVAEAVLRRSTAPVFLVRAWQEEPAGALAAARPCLVVPLDGSPFAEAALPTALDLASRLQARLVLISAIPGDDDGAVVGPTGEPDSGVARSPGAMAETASYLRRIRTRLRLGGYSGDLATETRRGTPAHVIEAAGRRHAALVVMATHGRGGLARLILGSVAESALRHGATPLLLVRPSELVEAAAGMGRPYRRLEGAPTTSAPLDSLLA